MPTGIALSTRCDAVSITSTVLSPWLLTYAKRPSREKVSPVGPLPTAMVPRMRKVVVSTTEIVFSPMLATHACRLSLVSVTTWARSPVAIEATVSIALVLMAERRPEARLVAKSQRPSRETARSCVAWLRASTVPTTWKVSPSTTVTELELSFATYTREWLGSSASLPGISAQPDSAASAAATSARDVGRLMGLACMGSSLKTSVPGGTSKSAPYLGPGGPESQGYSLFPVR